MQRVDHTSLFSEHTTGSQFPKLSFMCLVCRWTKPTVIGCFEAPYLALAQGALGAVFNPGGAAEAWNVVLVRARLGDVVADGICLAGVGDAAGTALALGHQRELAVHGRARQGPAIHLPLLQRRRRHNLRWEVQTEKFTKKKVIRAFFLVLGTRLDTKKIKVPKYCGWAEQCSEWAVSVFIRL